MVKKILFSTMVFVLVSGAGFGVAKAARPDRPVYPTVEEVQQMIATAIAPINTAITNLTSRVATLEESIPSPQPTYPTALQITTDPVWNQYANRLEVGVKLTSSTQRDGTAPIPNAQVWGVMHLSSGDITGQLQMLNNDTIYEASFPVDFSSIPYGTQIPVDIYGSYGGQTVKTTITVTKDF